MTRKTQIQDRTERLNLSHARLPSQVADNSLDAKSFSNQQRRDGVVIPEGMELRPAVQRLVEQWKVDPGKRASWGELGSINDWKEVLLIHPTWYGKSMGALSKMSNELGVTSILGSLEEGDGDRAAPRSKVTRSYSSSPILRCRAASFIQAFTKWARIKANGEAKAYEVLIKAVFPGYKLPVKRSSFMTMSDWKRELAAHPAWHGKSMRTLLQHRRDGGAAFAIAFVTWAKREANGDRSKYTTIVQEVFPGFKVANPPYRGDRLHSVADWKEVFSKHPSWRQKTFSQVCKDKVNNGFAIVQAFKRWAKQESGGNQETYLKLMRTIFPDYTLYQRGKGFNFQSVSECKAEMARHPEWAGLTITQILQDKKGGGPSFVGAVRRWAKQETSDDREQSHSLMVQVFPTLRQYTFRDKLKSLSDWQLELKGNPHFAGKTRAELANDKINGGAPFVQALTNWVRKRAKGSRTKFDKLMSNFFPTRKRFENWSSLKAVSDWKKAFKCHKEWNGMTNTQLAQLSQEGKRFVVAFRRWATKLSMGDRSVYSNLMRQINPSYVDQGEKVSRKSYNRIEDWKGEFNANKAWHGRSAQELREASSAGKSFVISFINWAKRKSDGNQIEFIALVREVFPNYRAISPKGSFKAPTTIEEWQQRFNLNPEWVGKDMKHVTLDRKASGNLFVPAFKRWALSQAAGDTEEYTQIIKKIFPSYEPRRDLSGLKSLADWKFEFDKHSEWHNKPERALREEIENGGSAFAYSFREWANEQAKGDLMLSRALITAVFPATRTLIGEAWIVDIRQGASQRVMGQKKLPLPAHAGPEKFDLTLDNRKVSFYRRFIQDRETGETKGVWAVTLKNAKLALKFFESSMPLDSKKRVHSLGNSVLIAALNEQEEA